MKPFRLSAAIGLAGALALGAATAHAQQAPATLVLAANDFAAQDGGFHGAQGRTLEWDSRKGRWGLKLGVEQQLNGSQIRDFQPGVYYRLTPRLHIGGGVSLAPYGGGNSQLVDPQVPAPRVRLETSFKF